MENISSILKENPSFLGISRKSGSVPEYRNRRDEIISNLTDEINTLRIGTKYKPVTKRQIAIRANSNPFLKSDDELELVYKNCSKKGNFSHFFWITK